MCKKYHWPKVKGRLDMRSVFGPSAAILERGVSGSTLVCGGVFWLGNGQVGSAGFGVFKKQAGAINAEGADLKRGCVPFVVQPPHVAVGRCQSSYLYIRGALWC